MDLKCSNCFAGTRVFKPFQLSKKCWKCQSIHHTDVAAQVCFDPPPLFSDRVHGITYPADPEEKADTDYEENYHYCYPQIPRVGGYGMFVKCEECCALNRFYNHSLISVACWRCQTILCEPTSEEVRLSEACGLAPRIDISWFLSGDFPFLGPEGAK